MPLIHSEISSPYGRYVDELKKGRLAYQFSTAVGKPVFYPRLRCPFSGLDDVLEWRISKATAKQHGIPEGLPYLTGFVCSFEQ